MYAAAALYGLGFGLFNPGLALLVADRSRSADEVPRMLSLHLALNGFGQFFTVYALKGLAGRRRADSGTMLPLSSS